MLIIAKGLNELSCSGLMEIYRENSRRASAEADAYGDLLDFFRQPGAVVCVWQERGRYRCALRLEPYRDGLLLTGLETAPGDRGRGYATALLRAVLAEWERVPVYSHIYHRNRASIRVHEKTGFVRISDTAVFLDGSASAAAGTYVHL